MAIENVVYLNDLDSHSNEDRIISTLVDGGLNDFQIGCIRVVQFREVCKNAKTSLIRSLKRRNPSIF